MSVFTLEESFLLEKREREDFFSRVERSEVESEKW